MNDLSDEQIQKMYVATHDHLLRAARLMNMADVVAWNVRADKYAEELKRRFAIVPTVYAMAG